MKQILTVTIIFLLAAFACAEEGIVEADTLQTLIEKMQNAPQEEKYLYMNAIKLKLRALQEAKREEALLSIQASIQNSNSDKQSSLKAGMQAYGNHGPVNDGFGNRGSDHGSGNGSGNGGGNGK